ncbi:unnamed protein product [Fusarium graminearum]|uniref:Chromosome 2, complete genome n=1 Tax=Gibberella zeae (strain ATCC MYA-4620 / CBS 123657 / FGSC 9075 / NRRL 31084 / PH-1) TaxID=229533 RepID=A0A098DEE4_GIBZE|nr:unnamed protein product [Fusarium graminearum]CZS80635.1 unnamed protein product [Fusarium graminearum]
MWHLDQRNIDHVSYQNDLFGNLGKRLTKDSASLLTVWLGVRGMDRLVPAGNITKHISDRWRYGKDHFDHRKIGRPSSLGP